MNHVDHFCRFAFAVSALRLLRMQQWSPRAFIIPQLNVTPTRLATLQHRSARELEDPAGILISFH
jgi:hypothetical protein